jgi:hypothetical protein
MKYAALNLCVAAQDVTETATYSKLDEMPLKHGRGNLHCECLYSLTYKYSDP